jgi:hypothetical protein
MVKKEIKKAFCCKLSSLRTKGFGAGGTIFGLVRRFFFAQRSTIGTEPFLVRLVYLSGNFQTLFFSTAGAGNEKSIYANYYFPIGEYGGNRRTHWPYEYPSGLIHAFTPFWLLPAVKKMKINNP